MAYQPHIHPDIQHRTFDRREQYEAFVPPVGCWTKSLSRYNGIGGTYMIFWCPKPPVGKCEEKVFNDDADRLFEYEHKDGCY